MWAEMGLFARGIALTLTAMSVASLGVMVERWRAFARSQRESLGYAKAVSGALKAGDWEAAAKTPWTTGGHLGHVLGAGIQSFLRAGASGDLAVDSLARALERTSQRETANLKKGLGLLATVSSAAPFVGLLGTVAGIINTFQIMNEKGGGDIKNVSGGISEALVTTAYGLLVAIPALVAFNYLNGRADAFAVDVSEASNELLDHACRPAAKKKD
jgi:biopolymer transport protein ExbB/biopolymer transport protein TolQ